MNDQAEKHRQAIEWLRNGEELTLWRALRYAVTDAPELGVTAIGPKPATVLSDIRITIGGRRFKVLLQTVDEE